MLHRFSPQTHNSLITNRLWLMIFGRFSDILVYFILILTTSQYIISSLCTWENHIVCLPNKQAIKCCDLSVVKLRRKCIHLMAFFKFQCTLKKHCLLKLCFTMFTSQLATRKLLHHILIYYLAERQPHSRKVLIGIDKQFYWWKKFCLSL